MSGHSKWHNIQERKGKQDAKRANLFTKYAKGITVAAQKGGGDANMNFTLRLAVEKARAVGMPKDNIDRAIKRGTGEIAGERMEEIFYEAFGPGGVAILIKAVTDNKNRTVSDLKHALNQAGGSLGGPGSVSYLFEQAGVIVILDLRFPLVGLQTRDDFELAMIEAGAEDITAAGAEIEIKTKFENFQPVLKKLKEFGVEPKESAVRWIAQSKVAVDKDVEAKLLELFSALEAHDDVEDYFTNAE